MSRRILVVDRNSGTRSQLANLLERTGYETQQARTGREALDAARQVQPALVLLEVNLAEVSGYEVCRELRVRFGDDVAIIFLSGDRTEPYDRAPACHRCRRLHREALRRRRTAGSSAERPSPCCRSSIEGAQSIPPLRR